MTISLLQMWLPIVLGTFLAWMASGLIHMVVKYHNSDYQRLIVAVGMFTSVVQSQF